MQNIWRSSQNDVSLQLGADEKRHGVVSLRAGTNSPDAVRDPYFVMNVYRVLAEGRFFTVARGEPFEAQWREDGLTMHWQPTETLPLEMRLEYSVAENADLSMRLWVRAARDIGDLEIIISSYFDFAYEPYGVLEIESQDGTHQKQPVLWKAEDQTFVRGHYIHLPRDDRSITLRADGRWNDDNGRCIAPAVFGPRYAWPVAVMASSDGDHFIVQNGTPASCDGVLLTYSSDNTHDHIRNHNATYFSLFGESLQSGDERTALLHQSVVRGAPTLEKIAATLAAQPRE